MKAPKPAICCSHACENNDNRKKVLCCSRDGKCANCSFHEGCATEPGGLVAPVVACCADESCGNALNGLQVLCCTSCGRCGDCTFHEGCVG